MTRRIHLKQRGFTILEVTVAVSIIAILAALLVYGISHLTASSKANSTGLSLQNTRNMLQEFDSAVGLKRNSNHWPWCFYQNGSVNVIDINPTDPAAATAPPNAPAPSAPPLALGLDFWNTAYRYDFNIPIGTLDRDDAAAPMFSPTGSFSADSGTQLRNGSYAVLYTQLAMRMMGSVSAVRTMMGNIPAGSTMVPIFVPGAPYATGNMVKGSDNQYYRAKVDSAPTGSPFSSNFMTDPSTDSANWVKLGPTETPDPILLDAWGNPIIMVPGAGLVGVWTNGKVPAVLPPTNGQIQAWATPPSGSSLAAYQQGPIVAADGKPFFVSAGPDGDFTAGDDNIYSFNK